MNSDGIVAYRVQTRAFNGEYFISYLEALMAVLQMNGLEGCVFIMDNVAFHQMAIVQEYIRGNGHALLFLPPYSPFFNPIENMFSMWKDNVRRARATNEANLMARIENGANLITPQNCAGYFRNMLGYIRRGIQREEIFD
jgi:transposase